MKASLVWSAAPRALLENFDYFIIYLTTAFFKVQVPPHLRFYFHIFVFECVVTVNTVT